MTIEKNVVEYRPVGPSGPFADNGTYEPAADIQRIFGVVRRQYVLALIGAAIGIVVAILALVFIQPIFTSSVKILLDQDRTKMIQQFSGEQAPASTDEYIATQIAIINSDIVAMRVIHNLNLVYDGGTKRLLVAPAQAADTGTKPRVNRVTSDVLVESQIDPGAIWAVQKAVSVYQVDKSFVIAIDASDPDPEMARLLATAYGDAYLTDQLSARFEAARNAGSWLEDRINTLRDQSLAAAADVEKFRAENNLASTDGRLLSDQQLGSLNQQLIDAQLALKRASSKVDVFKSAVDRNDVVDIIGIVGTSPEFANESPIRSLRDDYLTADGRLRDIVARWGEDNDQAKALRGVVDRQAAMIIDEARRLLAGYQTEQRKLQAEADAVSASVQSAMSRAQADNSTLATLRSMEQRSTSYNALYQEYLTRYQEAVQQQTLSLTTGRLISTAELPGNPVFPKSKLIVALLMLLGAGAGGAVGVFREILDRSFRTRRDVEREGVDFLGYVAAPGSDKWGATGSARLVQTDADTYVIALAERIDRSETTLDTIRRGIEISRRGASKAVAMVSLEASLSRSALALALAIREARSGRRVLLIDGDRQGRALSKALTRDGASNFADVVSGQVDLDAALVPVSENLRFLASEPMSWQNGNVVSFSADNLKTWSTGFDLVIVDLPPAGPISEARALGPALDGYICAVDWGLTQREDFSALLRSGAGFENKLIGVTIANVNAYRQPGYDNAYAA